MRIKRGIIRIGIVLTGLWYFYLVLLFSGGFARQPRPSFPVWFEIVYFFIVYVILIPSAFWVGCWILFHVGRWVVRGFQNEKSNDTPAQE